MYIALVTKPKGYKLNTMTFTLEQATDILTFSNLFDDMKKGKVEGGLKVHYATGNTQDLIAYKNGYFIGQSEAGTLESSIHDLRECLSHGRIVNVTHL